MAKKFSRKEFTYVYSKWFHHFGTMRVVKKKTTGELRLIKNEDGVFSDYSNITDSHALDVFVWLGRYLALKGKIPRAVTLEEIAVRSQRVSRAIREVNASEIYQRSKS